VKIVIASDHEGFDLKDKLIKYFHEKNITLDDLGTYTHEPVDFPVFAEKLGLAIRDKKADRGILLCGSGVGVGIAANRMPWVRAGICHDTYSSHQGVEHDDMNVLVMGAGIVAIKLAADITSTFLQATFSGEDRHVRRLKEVVDMGRRYCGAVINTT
jgi:RpiB/LacA/LacB family sugar-phosphate isomerase